MATAQETQPADEPQVSAADAVEEPPKAQSWDEFWAEVTREARTEDICGVTVTVPTDLPMIFQKRLRELQDSTRDEDLHELIRLLFGQDVLGQWLDAGMGLVQFQTVVAWGMGNAAGAPLTFAEAYAVVMRKVDEAGKAPAANRAGRRAASKKSSKSTGGPSKPTSAASTSSGRTTSRR